MSKKQEVVDALDTVIKKSNDFLVKAKDFITCVEILVVTATTLKELLSSGESAPNTESQKTYSFQEVRGIMASLASKGKKSEAKALLTKYGASRLSEVKEEDFNALAAEAKVLADD